MVCSPADRQGQPSSSKDPSPAPQFASKGNEGGGQLERSRKLNSEGLEVYGQDFVHGGDHIRSAPPPYLDPFDLLDAPTVDPMVPLRR
ncbi:hypothetical protein ABBQ32_012218 [Trebouxia sp. C0010 RCD-2024]